MLTRDELVQLYREQHERKILSVYVAGGESDPAERRAWTTRLASGLDAERRRIEEEAPDDLTAFGAARALIEEELSQYRAFPPDRGWVGFATPEAFVHHESTPVPMDDLVRWERGIRVAPYIRALKQSRVVVAALADSRRTRVFTYHDGVLSEHALVEADEDFGDLADSVSSKRASGHTGQRGEAGTDVEQRLRDRSTNLMETKVVEMVQELAGDDGFVVFGGTPEVVSGFSRKAPRLRGRMLERPSMYVTMTEAQVKDAVEEAASELSRSTQEAFLGQVMDAAKSGGRGCLGVEAIREALRDGRVDRLLISRTLRERDPDLADHFVGAAFEQGAYVDELSGSGGIRLDAEGGGVGARLRYVATT